ncbi:hypothetical protein LCGC14_0354700 [marine sediment metagenome]|uniref:Uncharacterized protein n=1 Tax=marine sediment metagenome TaxID=412755 RepID=A0A0F9T9L4_9ZZZZ
MTHNLPAVQRQNLISVTELHSLDVSRNGVLVSRADCMAILDGVVIGASCTQDQASRLADILVSSYPKSETTDPEVYARGLISILAEHGPDIGAEAVDALTRGRYQLPTRADVNKACHQIATKRLMARAIAKRHLAEHERRQAEERQREEAAASWGAPEERARKVRDIVAGHG